MIISDIYFILRHNICITADPCEITCNQDEQFVEEITSVNDLYFATSELGDGHYDCTCAVCDIPLEHRSVECGRKGFRGRV